MLVYDRSANRVVGRGRSVPLRWDGTLADLPPGIDAAGLRAVTERAEPTAVSALAAEVEADQQGRGLSRVVIEAMAAAARGAAVRRRRDGSSAGRLAAAIRRSHVVA